MDNKIIIFSGAPATGKNTITNQLCSNNDSLVALKKHRGTVNIEENNTYHNITDAVFEKMIANDNFIQYHKRYDRYYGIAKSELFSNFENNLIPIIHAGKIDNIKLIEDRVDAQTIKILLWSKKDVIEKRLILRHPNDNNEIKARINALDEEYKEWLNNLDYLIHFDLIIQNDHIDETSSLILNFIRGKKSFDYSFPKAFNSFRDYLMSQNK